MRSTAVVERGRCSRLFIAAALGGLLFNAATSYAQPTTLAVMKVPVDAVINVGETAIYVISVQNVGSNTALGVMLTDTLPGDLSWIDNSASCTITNSVLSCSFGSLAPGGMATVTVSAVTDAATCSGALVNVALAAAANASQAANAGVITVNCPSLELVATPDSTPYRPGRPAGIVLGVSNKGAGIAQNVHLNAHLPKMNGLVWSEDPFRGGCFLSAESDAFLLSCSLSNLLGGESASVHLAAATAFDSFFGDPGAGPFDGTVTTSNDASAGDHFDSLFVPARYPGDADGNALVTVSDVLYLINFLFAGGLPPP